MPLVEPNLPPVEPEMPAVDCDIPAVEPIGTSPDLTAPLTHVADNERHAHRSAPTKVAQRGLHHPHCPKCGKTERDFAGGAHGLRAHIPQCRSAALSTTHQRSKQPKNGGWLSLAKQSNCKTGPERRSQAGPGVCRQCNVCGKDGNGNDNPQEWLVCVECQLVVHTECYSNTLSHDSDWRCDCCSSAMSNGVLEREFACCTICGLGGGALKQVQGDESCWAHINCTAQIAVTCEPPFQAPLDLPPLNSSGPPFPNIDFENASVLWQRDVAASHSRNRQKVEHTQHAGMHMQRSACCCEALAF